MMRDERSDLLLKKSGQRESNPHSQLGRLEFYH